MSFNFILHFSTMVVQLPLSNLSQLETKAASRFLYTSQVLSPCGPHSWQPVLTATFTAHPTPVFCMYQQGWSVQYLGPIPWCDLRRGDGIIVRWNRNSTAGRYLSREILLENILFQVNEISLS